LLKHGGSLGFTVPILVPVFCIAVTKDLFL
jgi:hypothetical protein